MELTEPNLGRTNNRDISVCNLSLIMGDTEEEDLFPQEPKDIGKEAIENENSVVWNTAASEGGGKDRGGCNENAKGMEDDTVKVSREVTVAPCGAHSLDLSIGNTEKPTMIGANTASVEAKCDDDKKQEDNAKHLKAIPLNFIKETTMDGADKAFLEANCDNDKKEEDNAKALLENHAHSLDLLMGNIEEIPMTGVDIASSEEKCDNEKEQEFNAKALLLLESGSPLFKKKSNNKLGKVENFPSDCYSFLSLHGPCDNPLFFCFGMMVYVFQMRFLLLMVFSVLHAKWHDNGDVDNPETGMLASFIPANSSPLVQATQFIATLSFIVFADASFLDIARSVETFPTCSAEATKCMVFSCVLRFSQGVIAMFVTLLLIITSDSVMDIVLNFAAVVSTLIHFKLNAIFNQVSHNKLCQPSFKFLLPPLLAIRTSSAT